MAPSAVGGLEPAEIIAIGSELLAPGRVDSNSPFLTAELNALGIRVAYRTVVGDPLEALTRAIAVAVGRCPLVLTCGGLGPTDDDRTRMAVALALGRGLLPDPSLAALLEKRFAYGGPALVRRNLRQAEVIEGATLLWNDRGTAPGQWCPTSTGVIVLLPGPPRELQALFGDQVRPRLQAAAGHAAVARHILSITGMTESEVDELAAPIYSRSHNPETTILAAAPGRVELRVCAQADSPVAAEAAARSMADELSAALGNVVYSRQAEGLEEVLARLLRSRRQTLAVAESCTGGMLGELFTSISGASDCFAGGAICYSDRLKTILAGVPADLIVRFGAVSAAVAAALAQGIRERCQADWGLSITGIAGPTGGSETKPVGTVFIGLSGTASPARVYQHRFAVAAGAEAATARFRVRRSSVQMALQHLYMLIAESHGPSENHEE